ncbi:hypothetical protein RA2_00169 [Roseovarius sp. A-2]|nr:hypothetical protein RA2_00169 [Roseovarius sp. A-2]
MRQGSEPVPAPQRRAASRLTGNRTFKTADAHRVLRENGFQCRHGGKGERLDNDPSVARYGCFLPDLTGLARCLPAPTSQCLR